MPFAAGLRQSLFVREYQLASEVTRGDSLEEVLDRYLLAVEAMAESELVTSILLLSPDGKRLSHGSGPNLPRSYRDSIDGSEIGPSAGSCGTAAHFGRPVYVSDIATDPLWADYRHLALPHGLRSCWSTPIRDSDGSIIGTFAIYHSAPGDPTRDEIDAIDLITEHVAQAIICARGEADAIPDRPRLQLVSDNSSLEEALANPLERLMVKISRLETLIAELERQPTVSDSDEARSEMETLSENSRKLVDLVRGHIERLRKHLP